MISPRSRIAFFHAYLSKSGYTEPHLYIQIMRNGPPYYAYPDIACMAFLEYFAFEARRTNAKAINNYRNFARFGFQEFVYKTLGYTPPDRCKYHHDRIFILHGAPPENHFIIFNEVSGMIVDLINADLTVNDKTVPDISVGKCWGDHWTKNGFDGVYGERIKYEHNYPSYYPQAASNPQLPWPIKTKL